jgi:hypothetical protein
MDILERLKCLAAYRFVGAKTISDAIDEIARLRAEAEALKDLGYVRVPVVMTESLRSVYQNDNGAYQSAEDFHAAMLAAAKETSHD